MATLQQMEDSEAGKALAKVGFRVDPEHPDVFIKLFANSLLTIQLNKPAILKPPLKLSDPVMFDIFDYTEPTPSMRLQFPSVKAFIESVYDWR